MRCEGHIAYTRPGVRTCKDKKRDTKTVKARTDELARKIQGRRKGEKTAKGTKGKKAKKVKKAVKKGKKGVKPYWVSEVSDTAAKRAYEMLKKYKPGPGAVKSNKLKGSWLVSYPPTKDRRSISYKTRGLKAAYTEAMKHLWVWHCKKTGAKMFKFENTFGELK